MGEVAKEDPAQSKEPKFLGKAGWVKKAPGRLWASYKDRYVHVEKTDVVVYENEDLKNCLERHDLENFDKCQELRSPFKKKHRLILLRSPKSGNKVCDVKFQAQTAEEKEAWIKALCDGINRAKNKIFDEVKIDESCNLDHVTRTRPKANRNRRPPTRIHMKEVSIMSFSEDIDPEGDLMHNGTHHASTDGTEASKETVQVPTTPSNGIESTEKPGPGSKEDIQTEPQSISPKKDIKPPMPPTKEAKPSAPKDEPDDGLIKKVLRPPMPPSKEAKPSVSSVEQEAEKKSEKSPDSSKNTGPPPTPPIKPSSSSSNLAEASQSRPNSSVPTPPLKAKKPSLPAVEPDREVQETNDKIKEDLPIVRLEEPENPSGEGQVSEEESGETISSGINKLCENEPQPPTEPLRKIPSPVVSPKKKLEKHCQPDAEHIEDNTTKTHPTEEQDLNESLQAVADTSASSQAEEVLTQSEVPSVVVSLHDLATDSLRPGLCLSHGENEKKAEEKSVDSGQHSDVDSEGSGSEETLALSTAALRGSHAGLDVLDASEDDIQMFDNSRQEQTTTKPQARSESTPPFKPSIKAKSASIANLLSDSSACEVRQQTRAVAGDNREPSGDVVKLEAEVSLEMEKTSKLLTRVSQSQRGGGKEGTPEDLLAKAMEKLKKADHVLREVKKLTPAKSPSNRKSW